MDRRRSRSENACEALRLYLSQLRSEVRAGSVVLADSDGLVVGGSGDPEELEFLAAESTRAPTHQRRRQDIRTVDLDFKDVSLRLAYRGSVSVPVRPVSHAVGRILRLAA